MKVRPTSGFALVITLVLLALLVLAVFALGALTKVSSETAVTGIYQIQARQNALLGLSVALGRLQQSAGADDQLTGMAGITGMPVGTDNPARHWCGAWTGNSVTWLASGGEGGSIPALHGADAVVLVANGSLGAFASTRENDRVLALRLPLNSYDPAGNSVRHGSYAYWVGDEGVKLSVVVPAAEAAVAGMRHEVSALIPALSATNPALGSVLSYEQLDHVAGVAAEDRRSGFHALGVTHRVMQNSGPAKAGLLNINSSSARYWHGIGETYNRLRGTRPAMGFPSTFSTLMRGNISLADPSIGKAAGAPFASVDGLLLGSILGGALAVSGPTLGDFAAVMGPWLTVRSDTFRIRAYGEALNPADSTQVESFAYCEALVQRTAGLLDPARPQLGRRFVIVGFRWLAPPNPGNPLFSDI